MELQPTFGVYLSMFEQSILIDHASPRKAGTFAASLVAQIALGGVLLVIPLVYKQTLLLLPPTAPLQMPLLSVPKLPELIKPTISPSPGPSTPRIPSPFRAPTRVPTSRPTDQPLTFESAPDVSALGPTSIPFGFQAASAENIRIVPPIEKPIVKELAPVATVPSAPIRMTSALQSAKLIKQILPEYPNAARVTHVSGTVHLLGIIAKDGHIRELKVLDGHPLLRKAAVYAVSQWIYSPTLLSGQPVEVEAPIDVNFALK